MGALCYQFIEIKKIHNGNFLVSKRKNKNLFFIFIKKLFFYKIKYKIYIFCWRKKNFPDFFNFRERGGMLCPRRDFYEKSAMLGGLTSPSDARAHQAIA
jgi:hypothetical protein